MFYSRLQTVILLYGISLVHGFFHFNPFKLQLSTSPHCVLLSNQVFSSDPTHWIEQRVDHFNASDLRIWQMRYYKTMKSWKPEGPVLLYLQGAAALPEIEIGTTPMKDHGKKPPFFANEIAEEMGAAYFMLEHRYYGKSRPLLFPTNKELVYLTSRQALADVAHLLRTIKKTPEFQNSKVIVVGGSYAGNLATWMKLLYPELIDAVLASSAPVLAKKDFSEYYEAVTDTYRTYGSQECVNKVTEKFDSFLEMLQSPEGIEKLKKEQHICNCSEMTIPENQQYYLMSAAYSYEANARSGTPTDITSHCQPTNASELERWVTNVKNDDSCIVYDYMFWYTYQKFKPDLRAMWYQACTELGYFETTSSSKQMFGNSVPANFFYKSCNRLFGEEFDEDRLDQNIINTNRMYGGLTPNVTNVVFVNGDMDPLHRLGIVHNLSTDAPAIFIEGASQCPEFYSLVDESDIVKKARKRIKNLLKKWIEQA